MAEQRFPTPHLEPDPLGTVIPASPPLRLHWPRPHLTAGSLLFQKDLPQPPWGPASAEGPQPLKDSEVVFSQQPPGEAQVKPTLPKEQPPELADPKDVAGVSTQEPVSPASHTPEPPGLPGTSA